MVRARATTVFESVTVMPSERTSGTSPLVVDRKAGILWSTILTAVAVARPCDLVSAADAEIKAASATPNVNPSFMLSPNAKVSDGWPSSEHQIAKRLGGPAIRSTVWFAQERYSYSPTSLSVDERIGRGKVLSFAPRRNQRCKLPAMVDSRTNFFPSRFTTSVSRKFGLAASGGYSERMSSSACA